MVFSVFRKIGRAHTSPESIARRATNEEIFGPSSEDLQDLTTMTFKPKACSKILDVLEHRFSQNSRHWRQKLKSLTILQYFAIHGSQQCFKWLEIHEGLLVKLEEFRFLDSGNTDQGRAVRDKAQALLALVRNPEKLKEARKTYLRQRENVRKSIGTGRRSRNSRNTLELLRDSVFDEAEMSELGIDRAPQPAPPMPTSHSGSQQHLLRMVSQDIDRSYCGALCSIAEEEK